MTAPVTDPMPPITTMATRLSESFDQEEAPGRRRCSRSAPASRAPPMPGQRTRHGEGPDLHPRPGAPGTRRPRFSLSRTALMVRPTHAVPEPAEHQEDHGQNDQDHVVVGALARELEETQLARHERHVGPVGRAAREEGRGRRSTAAPPGRRRTSPRPGRGPGPAASRCRAQGAAAPRRRGERRWPPRRARPRRPGGRRTGRASPAKAIWPRDSCPSQPVSTVSDDGADGEGQHLGEGLLGRGLR